MKILGKRQSRYENDIVDDADVGNLDISFWRVPTVENWRSNLTINLTIEEATYLREKITTMPSSRDSLLALILKENRLDFVQFEHFDDIDAIQSMMTPELRRDYQLARDFSRFIFGAQIRYNVIYSGGNSELANELWKQYIDKKYDVNLMDIQTRLKPKKAVMHFLKRYKDFLDSENELDMLIIQREKDIKNIARAKLSNKNIYQYDGNSINMYPLDYRLHNVQRIVRDIFEGGEAHA